MKAFVLAILLMLDRMTAGQGWKLNQHLLYVCAILVVIGNVGSVTKSVKLLEC